jgi:DNA-binding transcriptional MocR family regulator
MEPLTPLERFIAAEKPDWMNASIFAVMVCLIHGTAEKNSTTSYSQDTIARLTGLSRRNVVRVLAELETQKWITVRSGKRQYNSNSYDIQFQNLPEPQEPHKAETSEDAKALAQVYAQLFLKHCAKYTNKKGRVCRRPLHKSWKERWPRVIQHWLDDGWSVADIAQKFEHAAQHPKLKNQFRVGPQGLIKIWPERKAAQ